MNQSTFSVGMLVLGLISFMAVGQSSTSQAAPAKDEARTALIIGNSGYASSPLLNPKNDARDLGKVLAKLGFEVDVRIDQSQRQMKLAIRGFREKLKRRGGVGLFYYAGTAWRSAVRTI